MKTESKDPRFIRILLSIGGVVLLIIALLGMAGWFFHYLPLIQAGSSSPPLMFNTALAIGFAGLSLLGKVFEKRAFGLVAAFLVFIISGLTFIEDIFSLDLGIDQLFFTYNFPYTMQSLGRMAPTSALCLFLSSISLALLHSAKTFINLLITKLLSGLATGIGAVVLIGYITGFPEAIGWPGFTGSSLLAALAICTLGFSVFQHALYYALQRKKIAWGPFIGALVFVTSITLALWQAFEQHQKKELERLTKDNALLIVNNLTTTIMDIDLALSRFDQRWAYLNEEERKVFWQIDSAHYVKDLVGLSALSWYDANLQELSHVADKDYEGAHNEAQIITLLKESSQKGKVEEGSLCLQGLFFIYKPLIAQDGTFQGFIVAELNISNLIKIVIPEFFLNYYQIIILDQNRLVYKGGNLQSPFINQGISYPSSSLGLLNCQIRILPTEKLRATFISFFPRFIITVGIIVALITFLGTYLWQITFLTKRRLEIALAKEDALFASSTFSIISTDINGIITSFNKAAENLLQYKAEELVGKATPVLFHDKEEMIKRAGMLSKELSIEIKPDFSVFTALAQKGVPDEHEWSFIRKDKTRLPIQLTITAIKNAKGEIEGYVGFAADLTEKKVVEHMRSEMVAITSHELRSPLTSIKGALELILKEPSLSQELLSLLQICKNNSDRLLRLVSDLLDLQKIEAGEMPFNIQLLSIQNILTESFKVNEPLAQSKNVSLKIDESSPSLNVRGDMDRLVQVMTNLIANAIKYSEPGQTVFISSETADSKVRLKVSDNGPGIPLEYQSHIFEKFYRVPSGKKKEGTGLGLSIAKTLTEKQGGRIGFETSPHGSTFWIELPIVG